MAKLFTLPDAWRLGKKTTFNKRELSQLMAVYGRYVSQGEWRDYALDCTPDMAVFSIFRHSHEQPLYTVAKLAGQGRKKPSRYVVHCGGKTLKQSTSLLEVLEVFEEDGK